MLQIIREHSFCYGHRVMGQGGKCEHLHGHNGKILFTCTGELDDVGRILDFSEIKNTLCKWIEDNWDHRFLVYENDPKRHDLTRLDDRIVIIPFNPTAENMAKYLVEVVGPKVLPKGIILQQVIFFETDKCSAVYTR